ncbi:hypothetical protein [Roseicyclus sp.]|uniref:hypothetical protein n=1 Tax=Roseicyclus sp. TaxID=1914329 RepID=UPI003F6C7DB9
MALTFPLSGSDFLDMLPVQDVQFQLARKAQVTGLRGGEMLSAEIAPALWEGRVSLAPMRARTAAEAQALIAALEVPGRKFHAFKKNQIGPAVDPLGTAIASASPVIAELHGTDPARLRLSGLPADFTITPGDFLAFDYNPGSGARRALHQVAQGRTADASGETTQFITVVPQIRTGALMGAAVSMSRAHCVAVMLPGSVSYGSTRNNVTSGLSFAWRQSLRV